MIVMQTIKYTIGIFFLFINLSTFSYADFYTLHGGLTNIYSSTIGRNVDISPNPTGIESGVLEVDIDQDTGLVIVAPGLHTVLSDFEGTISFLGTTRFTAVATDVTVYLGASGTLDSNRTVTVRSESGSPGADVILDIQNCTGLLCGLLDSVDLDLKSYIATVTFNEDYSVFMGDLIGMTEDGSMVEIVLNGMRL
jgi:hypothetical protein